MRRVFFLAAMVLVLARAGSFDAAGQLDKKRVVHAFLAKENDIKPRSMFSEDEPVIYLIWKGEHFRAGDEIRVIWIAEDVGDASPKDTKINEGSTVVYKSEDHGTISLSRPNSRLWPIGRYRAEIFLDRQFVQTLRFTIQSRVNVELN